MLRRKSSSRLLQISTEASKWNTSLAPESELAQVICPPGATPVLASVWKPLPHASSHLGVLRPQVSTSFSSQSPGAEDLLSQPLRCPWLGNYGPDASGSSTDKRAPFHRRICISDPCYSTRNRLVCRRGLWHEGPCPSYLCHPPFLHVLFLPDVRIASSPKSCPSWGILTSFHLRCSDLPLSPALQEWVDETLPRVPSVFEEKVKWNLSHTEEDFRDVFADNYKSAEENEADIQRQVLEEVDKGTIIMKSRSEVEEEYKGRFAVAAF